MLYNVILSFASQRWNIRLGEGNDTDCANATKTPQVVIRMLIVNDTKLVYRNSAAFAGDPSLRNQVVVCAFEMVCLCVCCMLSILSERRLSYLHCLELHIVYGVR